MIDYQEDSTGLRFAVYAQPRASRTAVVGSHDGMLKVAVAAPPVDGAANAALIECLAGAFGVPKSAVTIIAGETGKRKRVHIRGGRAQRLIELISSVGAKHLP